LFRDHVRVVVPSRWRGCVGCAIRWPVPPLALHSVGAWGLAPESRDASPVSPVDPAASAA
jgi:hypothetical protein